MRTVIFDLDGTLADTSGDLLAAANCCFADMGMDVRLTPQTDAGVALRGGRAMLSLGIERETGQAAEQAVLDAQYQPLIEHYARAIDVHTQLYPGTMEAIEQLRTEGFAVGICTNKPEHLAELLMTKLGVRGAFASLIGADTLPVRKPDPEPFFEAVRRADGDPKRACLIGDTVTDHKTARAAGVPSVLVTFGPGAKAGQADIRALEPDALLDRYEDLPAIAAQLLGH